MRKWETKHHFISSLPSRNGSGLNWHIEHFCEIFIILQWRSGLMWCCFSGRQRKIKHENILIIIWNVSKSGLKNYGVVYREIFIEQPNYRVQGLTIKNPDKTAGNIKRAYFLWLHNQSWLMMVMPLLIILWSTTLLSSRLMANQISKIYLLHHSLTSLLCIQLKQNIQPVGQTHGGSLAIRYYFFWRNYVLQKHLGRIFYNNNSFISN